MFSGHGINMKGDRSITSSALKECKNKNQQKLTPVDDMSEVNHALQRIARGTEIVFA